MFRTLRKFAAPAAIASLVELATAIPAFAQAPDPHAHDKDKPAAQQQGGAGMGMGMGSGGMMQMMEHCQQMMAERGGGPRGMPQLPPGNEKLQMQMHADMMRAMADIMSKYAARLPDRK